MSGPVRMTRRRWAPLNHREKEDTWLRLYGYRIDPGLRTPITTVDEALLVFSRLINMDLKSGFRAKARRAYLAALQGGRCRIDRMRELRPDLILDDCDETVADFRYLRLWEFNHVYDRATHSRGEQFAISGSDCARRKWANVLRHCMEDTVLLCRECHRKVTELEAQIAIATNRILLGIDR